MDTDFYDLPGHLIRRLHQKSVALFTEAMAQAGLNLTPVQFAALRMLSDHPGVDQATVASYIAYDRATLGKVVDRLVIRGLVNRDISQRDRRARVLHLTEEGQDMLLSAIPHVQGLQPRILDGLDANETKQFLRMLRMLTIEAETEKRSVR